MKNFLNNSFITIKKEDYLKLIIILVPLLNLMPGFNFDLYTPSMPALAHYFATSVSVIKNTVTSTLIGFAIMGFIFFCLYAVFVEESIVLRNSFSPKRLYRTYKELLTHRVFIVSIFLVGCCQIQLMTYATVGSFIVQNILHRTAIVYGNSALLIGVCYFSGTLTNRFLIKKWHVHHLSQMGLILLVLSSTLQLLLAHFGKFDLFNLVLPVMMICYCLGILFPTLSLRSLKIFPQYAGIATSVLICFGLGIASIGMFLISFIDINDLMRLSLIFLSVTILHCIAFYGFLNKRDAALA